MNDKSWFLGIDLGTGSCKTVVVDREGQVLGSGTSDYSSENCHQKWEEQNPEALMSGLIRSVREALGRAKYPSSPCAGMSIGGALHSLMALDGAGRPLSGVLTWVDNRAVFQGESVKKSRLAEALYNQTGCPAHGMYPLYKIIWFRENRPEVFRKTARFVSAKEYIFQKLTGEYGVDCCLAAGSGLFNIQDFTWNNLSLDLAGIQRSQLSELTGPQRVFRLVNGQLAREMGIAPETPLVIGSADAVNSSLGAGAIHPDQATCMIGTSGALRIISRRPILDPESRSWCYAVDRNLWLVGGAINNGGVVLSWLRETLRKAFPGPLEESAYSFQHLNSLAQKAGAGAGEIDLSAVFRRRTKPKLEPERQGSFFRTHPGAQGGAFDKGYHGRDRFPAEKHLRHSKPSKRGNTRNQGLRGVHPVSFLASNHGRCSESKTFGSFLARNGQPGRRSVGHAGNTGDSVIGRSRLPDLRERNLCPKGRGKKNL